MHRTILVSIFVVCVSHCKAEENVEGDIPARKDQDTQTRLYEALFENYNREIIPDAAKSTTKFGAAMITTKLYPEESTLDSNIWLRMVWTDSRLKWSTDEFKVEVLRVSPSKVWTPDFQLYNPADSRSGDIQSSCTQTNVLIYPNGEVLWVPPCRFFSRCKNTIKKSPSDLQTCTLKFGSWTYDGFKLGMDLYNDQAEMDLSDFDDITDWKLLSAPGARSEKYYECCTEPYIDISYNVTVQRKPE